MITYKIYFGHVDHDDLVIELKSFDSDLEAVEYINLNVSSGSLGSDGQCRLVERQHYLAVNTRAGLMFEYDGCTDNEDFS